MSTRRNLFSRSPIHIFKSILEYAYYADDHDYASLLAKLQVKLSATELNEQMGFIKVCMQCKLAPPLQLSTALLLKKVLIV